MSKVLSATATTIANELKVKVSQVESAIRLLDDGDTVPFIARYRKEATAGLSDTQLRLLAERLQYLRELDERREVVLTSIREQEKLTPELEKSINAADSKTRLEDLYLPYRPKRRTKAMQAKEAGLEPLAQLICDDPSVEPLQQAESFINTELGIETVEDALEGARQILMEKFAEDADLLAELRKYLWEHSVLKSGPTKDKQKSAIKFADYLDYAEALKKIPSHRALALFRGRREGALKLTFTHGDDHLYCENRIATYFNVEDKKRAADSWLLETVELTWKTKISCKLELELLNNLRELADEEAIRVFTRNLSDLLLAAPAGSKTTLGLDPGIRTGVKVAAIDNTGKLLDYTTVFPLAPKNEWHEAIASLAKIAAKHNIDLISIGNGTGSRETERLVADLIKMYPDLNLTKVVVSEAGASVYSASELASNELPDLDVSLRGAVSIARRLQDPLAELVKIEPKSIGVGQYQHDVNQTLLARSLEGVVEDCVNAVGVDVNTASEALLSRVAGLNSTLAKNIVDYRNEHGSFNDRQELLKVARMGDKTFQQSAGFLRILNSNNLLDSSAVHPETYPLVQKIVADKGVNIADIIGSVDLLKSINAENYVDEKYGLPTIKDVLAELEKPGRDPRPEFKTVQFKDGIEEINDLSEGMILDGVVSNVTNFGAFVDIGVHQDGLVHISAMTNRFISDPRDIVKAGDIVRVRVVDVDKARRRIGLSMKLQDEKINASDIKRVESAPAKPKARPVHQNSKPPKKIAKPPVSKKTTLFNTSMADALSKLKKV